MMTPSIVRAARSRLVRRRERARRSSSRTAHAATRPSRRWIWRLGAGGDLGVVGDEHDRPSARVELAEDGQHVGAGAAVEVAGRLVGEDERRLGDERPGDGDTLLLAAATARSARGRPGRPDRAAPAPPVRALGPLARGRRPGRAAASRRCRARSSAAAGCTTGRRSRWSGCGGAPARRRRGRRPACRPARRRPAVGRSRQPRMFIIVLLPEPDGPTIATNSPGSTSRLTSSRAGTSTWPIW